MAGFFQQFLRGAMDGFLGSPNLKDFKHASQTFTTNAYANSPKFKWLFHVYFDINSTIISDNGGLAAFGTGNNPGLLVKTIDLPKYSIAVHELNQYNRKRYVQSKITYDPIRISFHDDNGNTIRNLWHTYYSYYYFDPSQPYGSSELQNQTTQTKPDDTASTLNTRNIYNTELNNEQRNWGYAGETGGATFPGTLAVPKIPFFKSIKIFGFNQHNFALYQLINPIIENFSHDTYSYSETTGTMESSMQIRYEGVKYYTGALDGRDPGKIVSGFGDAGLYDKELSPIARPGTNKSILGQGGLVDSVGGIVSDLSSGNILGAIQTAGRVSKTFKNSQQLLQTAKTELVAGALSAASSPQVAKTVRSAFTFPGLGTQNVGPTPTSNTPAPVEERSFNRPQG